MSQLEVDKVIPQSGTTLTLGDSADTITIPSGATLDASNATLTLPDGSVTAAKLDSTAVDNTNTNSTVITGQTAETSIDGADSILIYDDSATALRKMTRTNFVAGIGGTNTPIVFAKANTTTSLPDATTTKVNIANEITDTDNLFSSSRFTVTSGFEGKYFIIAQVSANIATDGKNFSCDIAKNGSTFTTSLGVTNKATLDTFVSGCSAIVDLTTNDYIEITSYNGTGGTITVNANDDRVYLSITKLIE
jgi:hypothetical protein